MTVNAGHWWILLLGPIFYIALFLAVGVGGFIVGWTFRRGWDRGAPGPPAGRDGPR